MLLLVSSALASLGTATFDAGMPVVDDLDLLPEPGAWPCAVTLQVDALGAITERTVARGCPSGVVETARALAGGWTWGAAAGPHAESVTMIFRVLRQEDPEPKPATTAGEQVWLLRPMDLLPPPPGAWSGGVEDPAAPYQLAKPPKVRLPGGAEAARVVSGTCNVRVAVGADGKVTSARATRCLDLLAPVAVSAVKKLKFAVAEGAPASAEFDLPVRFAPAE